MPTYDDLDTPGHTRPRTRVRAADAETQEYRATNPNGPPPRACYVSLIGDSPTLGPGDVDGARAYLLGIQAALEQGGWSDSERTRLYRLEAKWRRRAEGKDPRFMVAGTRSGRLLAEVEAIIRGEVEAAGLKRVDDTREGMKPKQRVDRRRRTQGWDEFGEAAELPDEGRAKGGADLDGGSGVYDGDEDDEPGDSNRGKGLTDRDFIIPGTDAKGHSHRIQCRLMPAHFRALCVLKDEGRFPFRTLGDIMRLGIHRVLKDLQRIKPSERVESHMLQVAAIMEILTMERQQAEFAQVFDALAAGITRHVQDQAVGEARRVVALVKARIEAMPEGYWRDKYTGQLRQRFGHLLDGEGVKLG